MDIDAVLVGLAAAAEQIPGLRALDYLANAVSPPVFVAGDYSIDYLQTFGSMESVLVTCRVLVPETDERAAQKALRPYRNRDGERSIKAALEADPTLGGACDDLVVQSSRGPKVYTVAENVYFGAEFPVLVIGD